MNKNAKNQLFIKKKKFLNNKYKFLFYLITLILKIKIKYIFF